MSPQFIKAYSRRAAVYSSMKQYELAVKDYSHICGNASSLGMLTRGEYLIIQIPKTSAVS